MPLFARNRQYDNVGNLGDILKHGVLVRLLREARCTQQRVTYVDPYCFLPTWPCANRRWIHDTDALVKRTPSFAEYQRLEHEQIRCGGPYLCSVGIASRLLEGVDSRLLLAEKEGFEPEVLRKDLGGSTVVMEDAMRLMEALGDLLDVKDLVIALVDPFRFDAETAA